MMKKLTVLITGGTSGIGLAVAESFAKKGGFNIFLTGLEENGAETAANLKNKFAVETSFFRANLAEEQEINLLVEHCFVTFGGVDVLINNAGIQYVSPIENFPIDKWNLILSVNLTAAFQLTKRVWNYMKKEGFGRIINISSAHGLRASEFKSAYVAAKHGLNGLTKVTALEGAPFGITCNAICPGYVRTPLVEKQIKEQAQAHQISEEEVAEKVLLKKQAVKKFVQPELIGKLCLMLTEESADMISGAAITADGAWSVQ